MHTVKAKVLAEKFNLEIEEAKNMRTLSVGYKVREHKKVLLLGITPEFKNFDVSGALMGMGKCEWEKQLHKFWEESISEALQKGDIKANVTKMFSCDFSCEDEIGTYGKPQADVIKFLMEKLFDDVIDTEEALIVFVKPDVLKKFSK